MWIYLYPSESCFPSLVLFPLLTVFLASYRSTVLGPTGLQGTLLCHCHGAGLPCSGNRGGHSLGTLGAEVALASPGVTLSDVSLLGICWGIFLSAGCERCASEPSAAQSLWGELGSTGMEICANECIPVPFKALCPQVSSTGVWGQDRADSLCSWGRDKCWHSLKWRGS